MNESCKLLCGYHNFCNFTTLSSDNREKDPRKTIEKFYLQKLSISDTFDNVVVIGGNSNIEFYEFFIQADSFLYNQIRRMVAAIIDVGLGHITIEELRSMIPENDDDDDDIDSNGKEIMIMQRQRWPLSRNIQKRLSTMVPACGLYLVDVGYDEQGKLILNFRWMVILFYFLFVCFFSQILNLMKILMNTHQKLFIIMKIHSIAMIPVISNNYRQC